MIRYIFCLITLFALYSCENKNVNYFLKKEDIRNVSIEIPNNFSLKKSNSMDTYIYDVFFKKEKVGSVYFGSYYPPFVEDYSITEEKEVYAKVRSKGSKIYHSKYLEQDYKNGIFNDNYYYYDTINKSIAQVMLPKKPGKGLIGIYFDSVDIHKNKFAIVSNNLSEENKKIFLEIFKTIRIKNSTH